MKTNPLRHLAMAVALLAGVWWATASVPTDAAKAADYPEKDLLVDAGWLKENIDEPNLIVVDVRDDKYFDGKLVPGAVRLPWSDFRYDDVSSGVGELFVGTAEAQKILGRAGLSRPDHIVLYDSVKRDGGATASYVFWVLDLLGHEKKSILERGIDAWVESGGEVVSEPRKLGPSLYQALREEMAPRRMADGEYVLSRLGDPYYRILDVRSRGEYLGEKANAALDGSALKLGHIPGAINIDYTSNWIDQETKKLKPYEQLRQLYRGVDSSRAAIVYCHSARRSSFSYFVLRLMGFSDPIVYEPSWFEWGGRDKFFPVELEENAMEGGKLPEAARSEAAATTRTGRVSGERDRREAPKGGYVSCGG